MPDPDPTFQPALRELTLVAAWAGALLLAAANYLANHAFGQPIRRVAYTVIVVLVCGTMIPAVTLGALMRSRVVEVSVTEAAIFELIAATLVGVTLLAAFLRGQPREVWRGVPALAIALFAPSVAEVLVFAALVQSVTEHALAIVAHPTFAVAAAVLVSSIAFALYHLTHGPPWNRWPMIRTLFVVWLAVAAVYAVTRNLWAASVINTSMASIGFIKSGVTRAREQPLAVSVALDLAAVLAVVGLVGWMVRES